MQYAVIMAGGTGTRFWPLSRVKRPKQFLNLIGDSSMLQTTVNRITEIIPIERVLVVTNESYKGLVKNQLPELPDDNIIGEPVGRNTAPCIAAAAAVINNRDDDATMVVLPSDHYIRDKDRFLETLKIGIEKAEAGHNLITIGIRPHRPETGYGYIQLDEENMDVIRKEPVYLVKTFAEKPDLQTAVHFLESGDFLWNSGIFIWKVDTILTELEKHLPQVYAGLSKLKSEVNTDAINRFYQNCPSISIDYGIMEKTEAVHVVPAEFGWNDVGSWMAVYELEEKKSNGNVLRSGNGLFENCQNCLITSDSSKLIAMVGLQGVGVIETEDAILITRMDRAQEVRNVVDKLDDPKLQKYK